MAGKGLGKGLKALIADDFDFNATTENEDKGSQLVFELDLNRIRPNKGQPRKNFDAAALRELADSISVHGILQPLVVKKEDDGYTIIAGERRFRAAKMAGLTVVPVILKDLDPKSVMEIALIENVQREDLNPMEVAAAYDKLIKSFGLTQKQLSERLGVNRATISNTMRLLGLPETVREMVMIGDLSAGHARALLSLEDETAQCNLAEDIKTKGLSVRETEAAVRKLLNHRTTVKKPKETDIYLKDIEERLTRRFMTKTAFKGTADKGRIEISYHSSEELNRLLELLHLEEEN